MAAVREITISTRVPEDVGAQIDQLATAMDRNRSWVLGTALKMYLSREMQFLTSVQAGIDAYNAGDTVDNAEVVKIFTDMDEADKAANA